MLSLAFVVRALLFSIPGYKIDLNTFAAWFSAAAEHGIRPFYLVTGWHDYPPFNIYIFWLLGSVAKNLSLYGTPYLAYLIKLPSNIFDLATAFLIFVFVRRKLDFKLSLMASALYAFNPAAIFDGAIWGQYDGIYTFFLIASLMLVLNSKPKLSAAAFAVALLTKPQSIALAPLLVFFIIRKFGWKRFATSTLAALATVFIVILPFEWSNPVAFLFGVYSAGYGGYPFTSINAFNVWAFWGFWKPDTHTFLFVNFFSIGWILFGAVTVFALYVLHKRFNVSGEVLVLFSAFILFFSFFMLPTRIHERYMFPALSVLAIMFPFIRKTRLIYGVLSLTCLVNQAYVLYFLNADRFIPDGDPVVFVVSLINLAVLLYVLMLTWTELKGKPVFDSSSAGTRRILSWKVKRNANH